MSAVKGFEPVRTFCGQRGGGGGINFSRFCADVFYGRPLSKGLNQQSLAFITEKICAYFKWIENSKTSTVKSFCDVDNDMRLISKALMEKLIHKYGGFQSKNSMNSPANTTELMDNNVEIGEKLYMDLS